MLFVELVIGLEYKTKITPNIISEDLHSPDTAKSYGLNIFLVG